MSARLVGIALVVALVHASAAARAAQEPVEAALFARAASGDEAAERALIELGEAAGRAALVDFALAPPAERRLRALVVERTAGPSAIQSAITGLADVDADVRAAFARFLARPELLDVRARERIERLQDVALADAAASVREACVRAIADIDDASSAPVLDGLIEGLSGAERALAASLLAAEPSGRARAEERLGRAAQGLETAEVFAALLVPCARRAADDPEGFEVALRRAPILNGLRHFDRDVRAAAAAALDAHVTRLLNQQEYERAVRVLELFEADGFDSCRSLEERARIALLSGKHDEEALFLARELDSAARAKDEPAATSWRARAAHLEALAWLAADEPARAEEPLARARRFLDLRLSSRAELTGKHGAVDQVALAFERASVAVSEAGCAILAATPANAKDPAGEIPRAALEAMRAAHRLALEAQRTAWRAEVDAPAGFDVVWQANVGLFELVIDVARRPRFWPDRALFLKTSLGRAFASVAPLEALGFEPVSVEDRGLADPNHDPRRRALLVDSLDAMCDQLANAVSKARRVLMRAAIEAPGGAEPEEQRALLTAEFRFQDAVQRRQLAEDGDFSGLAELRTPSSFVVWLARALREEGRAAEARPYLLRARDQLDASLVAQNFLWGIEMKAEIEMMLGSTISDDGDPRAAEIELVKAERRLLELETTLKERGASNATLTLVRNQRCNALVSLAVNANVKMKDPKKAVQWFEQAWEIRQDDFMRVLLACYRARQGKSAEARALVRDVTPGPGTFYNLACTWALLGETETALAFLKRDLNVNYPSAGALVKQKAWARADPDLESMRSDPRFVELVGDKK